MKKILISAGMFALSISFSFAQSLPVIVEAESGVMGNDWTVQQAANVKFVTSKTEGLGSGFPGSDPKVITYKVTFPQAGVYDLYARVRVGKGGSSDDSFYYGKGFGEKTSSADNNDWITVNGLYNVGYTDAEGDAAVDNGGTAKTMEWKWINLSKFTVGEPPVSFKVKAGALTQTFQIGGREDGLDLDKFAFALNSGTYTVSALNAAVVSK